MREGVQPGQPQPATDPDPGPLDRPRATTERVRECAEAAAAHLRGASSPALARSVQALTDLLIEELMPLMAAEESAIAPRLDGGLREALAADHRRLAELSDRLEMLIAPVQRRVPGEPDRKRLARSIADLTVALDALLGRQEMAYLGLAASLGLDDLQELAGELDRGETDARRRTVLIAWPEIPPTTAHVMRSRPELHIAYPTTLAALKPRPGEAAGQIRDGQSPPGPLSGRPEGLRDRRFVEVLGAQREDHGRPQAANIGDGEEGGQGHRLAPVPPGGKGLPAEAGASSKRRPEPATELGARKTGQLAGSVERPGGDTSVGDPVPGAHRRRPQGPGNRGTSGPMV